MESLALIGRVLMLTGAVLLLAGSVLVFAPYLPLLGKLPGDLLLQRDRLTVFVPIASMIVVSILLTLMLNLLPRLFR